MAGSYSSDCSDRYKSVPLERYIQMEAITPGESDSFLFGGIVQPRREVNYDKGGLSYTTVRESVVDRLEIIGQDRRLYGLHRLEKHQLKPMPVFQIACLNDIGAGIARTQKIVM